MYASFHKKRVNLSRIATTQASVKVVIRIFSGFIPAFNMILAVLRPIICVLPVHGHATTITGP
ncbi:MAG: hypothetical protein ACPHY8_05405 [Patescibacteria group bacterium]